jgi:hypothetical protein
MYGVLYGIWGILGPIIDKKIRGARAEPENDLEKEKDFDNPLPAL